MQRYNGATKTITGIKTRDVKFNDKLGMYQGQIMNENEKWVPNLWDINGVCQSSKYAEGNLLSPLF